MSARRAAAGGLSFWERIILDFKQVFHQSDTSFKAILLLKSARGVEIQSAER